MTGYDSRFFNSIRQGSRDSAAALAPIVADTFEPDAVVDVGCGEGWWGAAFADLGANAVGLDGGEIPDAQIAVEPCDLAREVPAIGRFDLAVCLEVAEHLPPARAEGFVAELCRLAPVVAFSAAVPGQGGTGHLNEQWPGYWADLFAQNGYQGTGALRWSVWDDERIKWWYRQNLLVFARDLPGDLSADGCPAVVHPACWAHHGR